MSLMIRIPRAIEICVVLATRIPNPITPKHSRRSMEALKPYKILQATILYCHYTVIPRNLEKP